MPIVAGRSPRRLHTRPSLPGLSQAGGLTWKNDYEPIDHFRQWQPRATKAAIDDFASSLRRGSWYSRINRRTGFSGTSWRAVQGRSRLGRFKSGFTLWGANYVPHIQSKGTTGIKALTTLWRYWNVLTAMRRVRF